MNSIHISLCIDSYYDVKGNNSLKLNYIKVVKEFSLFNNKTCKRLIVYTYRCMKSNHLKCFTTIFIS